MDLKEVQFKKINYLKPIKTNTLKRIAAILLVSLLFFNWFGYKLVLNQLQQQADRKLEARIDAEHYDESQLLEIRVALNMPYQSVQTEYERHYGEIEIEGKQYTYVKRKIEDGYLVLKCIPNHQKDLIKNTSTSLFKALNGMDQQSGKSSSPFAKVIKCFSGEFENDRSSLELRVICTSITTNSSTQTDLVKQGFTTICEQPPDHSRFV